MPHSSRISLALSAVRASAVLLAKMRDSEEVRELKTTAATLEQETDAPVDLRCRIDFSATSVLVGAL